MPQDLNFNANLRINTQFDDAAITKGLQEIRKKMGNLTTDQTIFKGVDKEFVRLQNLLTTLKNQEKDVTTPAGLNAYQKTLERVRLSAQRIGSDLADIANTNAQAFDYKDIQQLNTRLQTLNTNLDNTNNEIEQIKSEMNNQLSGLGFNEEEAQRYFQIIENGGNAIQATTDIMNERVQQVQSYLDQYNELISKAQNVKINAKDQVDNKGNFHTKTEAENFVRTTARDTIYSSLTAEVRDYHEVVQQVQRSLEQQGVQLYENSRVYDQIGSIYDELITQQTALLRGTADSANSVTAIANDIENYYNGLPNATSAIENLAPSLQQAQQEASSLENEINSTTQQLNELQNQRPLENLGEDIANATNEVNNLVDSQERSVDAQREQNTQQNNLNSAFDKFAEAAKYILSIGNAWRQLNQIIRQTFQDVQKLDQAFASIAMVTDYSVDDLWSQYDNYSDIANRLGQTTEGAIKSSALFYQQGLDTAEALSLTENTLKMATLAGEDYTTATTQMTAALRGFHMEMEEGSRITDVYSELAANAAADVQGIAYAMSKTASIANNAGMSFEATSAFITNMIETTQEAPENIG